MEAGVDIGPKRPPGIRDTAPGPSVRIEPALMPWLHDAAPVNLVRVTSVNGDEFLLGSMIRGKDLEAAAGQLTEPQSSSCNSLLYNVLPDLIRRNFHPNVKLLEDARSTPPILYAGNRGGQRVYFVRCHMTDLQGGRGDLGKQDAQTPVIIQVAVCDKAQQMTVLSVLTDDSHRRIKHLGRL